MRVAEETINQAIRHAINGILSIPEFAIRGQQDDLVMPQGSLAVVTLILDDTQGIPYAAYDNGYRTESYQTISYSLSFFRKGAYDYARDVASGFYRDDIRAAFNTVGLGQKVPGSVRNISEVFEEGWEERAQFDLDFDYVAVTDASPDDGDYDSILSYSMDMVFNDRSSTLTCGDSN